MKIKATRLIGMGQCGVYECRLNESEQTYADKKAESLDNEEKAAALEKDFKKEFIIGKNLQHPNIVKYYYYIKEYIQYKK